jgi:RNA polymerase sigma-70 factor (ECF subfamily)
VTRDAEDNALVECARRGDAEAFAALYERYRTDVWNFALLTLRHREDAEDSVQETFLKAYRALHQYRRGDSLRPWLLTICRNVCLDRLRAAPRRATVPLDDDGVARAVAPASDQELRIDFHRAFAELPAEEREAFFLVDVLGCRSEHAASILGLRAASTLRSRVARARRALASDVAEHVQPPLAEIWGVYHSATAAVVVAGTPASAEAGAGRHLESLRARLAAPPAPPALAVADRDGGLGLVGFFAQLDRRIPLDLRVLAIVDGVQSVADAAARTWLATHPRWLTRCVPTHDSWRGEVERLLAAAGDGAAAAMVDGIDREDPFLWTYTA